MSSNPALPKPTSGMLLHNWWPVAVWLGILRLESTDLASSSNTSILLYRLSIIIFGRVNFAVVSIVNEVGRKVGHFLGYGFLGALIFFALKQTYRDRVLLAAHPWGRRFADLWQRNWALTGVLFTAVVAAADEIHQSFIPSRTGRWQDVLLDTVGAIVLQLIIYAHAQRIFDRSQQHATPPPQLSSSR